MNKTKKFLSFFLSILVTFILFGTTFSKNVKADTLPVQLYYGKYIQTAILDGSCYEYSATGYIAVQKSSYSKNISIHYSTDNGTNWQDTNANYVKDNSTDGYEIWSFNLALNDNSSLQFAIKYESNGETYWDNNYGKNYYLSSGNTSTFGKSQLYTTVYNDGNVPTGSNIIGSITLNNIGNPKVVKIRYSYDNWATYLETNANYNSTSNNNSLDYWDFTIPSNPSSKQVKFAISYEVNGIEYWDNNFGNNYTVNYV
ncbi:hypothetical protein IAI10_17695 [Clostridium sp. 19966]|uniref:carbohydrate-binding protein n=1 Tax=Clostridium sp. 19966 TaxID=2768166 RepID=UPI0028DE19C8|nr:carbohydrate-binding protein [Clostridium sp. 19966]MDT8718502.1 hypothetical protein [Clostridium sp. 19966]